MVKGYFISGFNHVYNYKDYSIKKEKMRLTKNFIKSEFDCHCGCEMPNEVLYSVQKVANQLQLLRSHTGKSITVNSAYRCQEHNTAIGSNNTSQHILGKAADITIKGYTPDETSLLIKSFIEEGKILQGGVGMYNTFTHYDIRKTKALWNNKS